VFSEKKSPTALYAIRDVRQPLGTKSVGVAWLLREIGAVKSNSEGMRKIQEGAVDIDGESVSDPKATLSWEHGKQVRLRMGRRYFRVDMKIGG
jgi:tyrosyl-tRNA synthetase